MTSPKRPALLVNFRRVEKIPVIVDLRRIGFRRLLPRGYITKGIVHDSMGRKYDVDFYSDGSEPRMCKNYHRQRSFKPMSLQEAQYAFLSVSDDLGR